MRVEEDSAVVYMPDVVYVFELKYDGKRLYKIGVNFSSEKRTISEWIIKEEC